MMFLWNGLHVTSTFRYLHIPSSPVVSCAVGLFEEQCSLPLGVCGYILTPPNFPCIALRFVSLDWSAEEAQEEEKRMAICAAAATATATALGLKPIPSLTKLQGSSPTNTNTNCRPPFAFSNIKGRCHANGNGSACKIANSRSRGSGMDRVSQKKDGVVVMDRRQAMGLMGMGMGMNWATSAMATPNPNPNPNPIDDEEDEDARILQSAPLTFNVGRPVKKQGDEGEEEVLTVSLRVPRGEVCGFNAFVNLPDAQSDTPITRPQFAGTFFNEPHRLPHNPFRHTQWRIGISDIIQQLGLSQNPKLLVTIVPTPATLPAPILIKTVTLQLESL